jgi:hypothetical protein
MVKHRRVLTVILAILGSACRRDAPGGGGGGGEGSPTASGEAVLAATSAAASANAGATDELHDEALDGAAGRQARGVESQADELRDAGAPASTCSGTVLGLVRAAEEPRCAIGEREWNALKSRAADAGAESSVRQEARREGDRIVIAAVNRGKAPVDLPLRFAPGRPDLPAITVLAEDVQHAVFELASPIPDDERDGSAPPPKRAPAPHGRGPTFDAGWLDLAAVAHVYSARIRLPPGGAAQVAFRVDPKVVKRLDDGCREHDAAACTPARLPRGHYVLYVGQLIVAADVGAPARIEWDAP